MYHYVYTPLSFVIISVCESMLTLCLQVEAPATGLTARNSTSLLRAPGLPTTSVKGEATNYPFWPGGLDEPELVKSVTQSLSELNLDSGGSVYEPM